MDWDGREETRKRKVDWSEDGGSGDVLKYRGDSTCDKMLQLLKSDKRLGNGDGDWRFERDVVRGIG